MSAKPCRCGAVTPPGSTRCDRCVRASAMAASRKAQERYRAAHPLAPCSDCGEQPQTSRGSPRCAPCQRKATTRRVVARVREWRVRNEARLVRQRLAVDAST